MDYKVILKDLADVTGMVKTWERQGYAPSIEKDSVLEILRKVYAQLSPDIVAGSEAESGSETGAVEIYREDNGIESLMEFIRSSQAQFMAETAAQISEIKDVLAKGVTATPPTQVTPPEEPKMEEPKIEEPKKEEFKPTTDIKVEVKPSGTPVFGFYSLPESMRMDIVHDLFDGEHSKAELAVNKMCSLKSIDDLLIYIEEHFQWSPNNATAASLISMLSKKYQ